MSIIKIDGKVYNALRTCAGKDDVRYYLNGILFDFANELLVATDGHRLLTYPIEKANEYPRDLPDMIIATASRKADREGTITVEISDDATGDNRTRATITSFSTTGKQKWAEIVDVIDGKFPDYAKVIPERPSDKIATAALTYNPSLIGSMVDALTSKPVACRVMPTDGKGSGPLWVEVAGFPDAVLILMPMRWGA